jgi:hypothetical protein
MKRVISILLAVLLTVLFVTPVSAKESNNTNIAEKLEIASDQIIGNKYEAFRTKDMLSTAEVAYLDEKGIDTNQIIKVYYRSENNSPIIEIVTDEGDNKLTLTTLMDYERKESGKIERVSLSNNYTRGTWYNTYVTDSQTFGTVTLHIYVDFYYYLYDGLFTVYYRPYKLRASYTNSSGLPQVENLYVHALFYGDDVYYSGNSFARLGTSVSWNTTLNVSGTLTAYTGYYQTHNMLSNHCMDLKGTSYDGHVDINGQTVYIATGSNFDGVWPL